MKVCVFMHVCTTYIQAWILKNYLKTAANQNFCPPSQAKVSTATKLHGEATYIPLS